MPRTIDSSGLTSFVLVGGTVVATVSGNALTVSLKTSAGNDPSPTEPMYIALRTNPTSAGQYSGYTIAGPVSMTISSGSTLGVSTSFSPFRLWAEVFYNSDDDTIRLGVIQYEDPVGTAFVAVTESRLTHAVADSSGGSDSAQTLYSNVGTGLIYSYRFVAMLDWNSGLATPGAWDTAPTVYLYKNGMPLSGEIISSSFFPLVAASNFPDLIPDDDTPPLSTEGKGLLTIDYSPAYFLNTLIVEADVMCTRSLASNVVLTAFSQNGHLIGDGWQCVKAADDRVCVSLRAKVKGNDFGLLRIGGDIAGTTYVNSISTGRKFGGQLTSGVRVTEVMA